MKTKINKLSKISKKNLQRLKEISATDSEILRRLEELARKADLHEAQLEFLLAYLRMLMTTKDLDVISKPRVNDSSRGKLGQITRHTAKFN